MIALLLGLACATAPGDSGPPEPSLTLHFINAQPWRAPLARPVARGPAALRDLDGDGHLDLIEASPHGVLLSLGGEAGFGALRPLLSDAPAALLEVTDLDGDGDLDLVFAGAEGAYAALQTAPLQHELLPLELPDDALDLQVFDADGDGVKEVFALHPGGLAQLQGHPGPRWRARGGGLPSELVGGSALAAGDVDGDGVRDLFIAAEVDRLYLGDGAGGFLLAPPDALPLEALGPAASPLLADLDGDGDLDLLRPSSEGDRLLHNDGSGRFIDETPFTLGGASSGPVAARAVDLDGDERLDLVLAQADAPLLVLRADREGRFFDYSGAVVGLGETAGAEGLAVGDVDGDGAPDLYLARDGLRLPWLLMSWGGAPSDDADLDGVPDRYDVCPDEADPEQGDRDASPFACAGAADCLSRLGCDLLSPPEGPLFLRCPAERSWSDARAACQALGGDLATLDSLQDQAFIAEVGAGGAWIGLSDREAEGAWVWVDGGAVEHPDWGEGEPNDAGEGEDCAHLSGDGASWNDRPCGDALPALCAAPWSWSPADPGDACDNCPGAPNADQADSDGDGLGDACDPD